VIQQGNTPLELYVPCKTLSNSQRGDTI